MADGTPPTGKPTAEAAVDRRLGVAKNTVVLVALRVGAPALSVLLMLVLSRALGAEGVGRYSLAYSFLYLWVAVGPLGLQTVITREGARDRSQLGTTLANSNTLGTIAALILTGMMLVIALFGGYDAGTSRALLVLTSAILPFTLGAYLDATIIALERMEYIAVATLVEYVFKVGFGVWLLTNGHGLESVLVVAVIGRVLACIVSMVLLARAGVPVRWAAERGMLGKLLRLTPTFLMISAIATLYWRIDIFMLSKLKSIDDVGFYGAAWRLLSVAMVIPQGLCQSLYPQIAAAAGKEGRSLENMSRIAVRYLFAATLPAAACVSLLAGPLLALFYGEPFREAAWTLSLLIWTLVPYGIVRYHAYVLVAMDRQRVDLNLNLVMTVINVALNVALIPRYGHGGAAMATLASIAVYLVMQRVYVRRSLSEHGLTFAVPWTVVAATAVTAAAVWGALQVHVLLALAVAPVVYGVALLALRFFTADELELLKPARWLALARR